jgi:hypothetical protein
MVYNSIVLVGTRGAQIRKNYVNKQTGAQSIATISMNLASGLVCIATTIKEIGFNFHIPRLYGMSVLLNIDIVRTDYDVQVKHVAVLGEVEG